jgi:hypothetical protein
MGKNLNVYLLKSGMKQEFPLLPLLFYIVLEFLIRAITQMKNKWIQIGREEIKRSLLADLILNLKDPPKTPTENS